jgi:hypothetical protein
MKPNVIIGLKRSLSPIFAFVLLSKGSFLTLHLCGLQGEGRWLLLLHSLRAGQKREPLRWEGDRHLLEWAPNPKTAQTLRTNVC